MQNYQKGMARLICFSLLMVLCFILFCCNLAPSSGGSSGSSSSNTFIDTNIPAVSITSPADMTITNNSILTISGTAVMPANTNSDYITSVFLSTNNSAFFNIGNTNWTASNLQLSPNKTNTIVAMAISSDNQTNISATNHIIIDTTPPVLSSLLPAAGNTVATNFTVSGLAIDNLTGVSKVLFTIVQSNSTYSSTYTFSTNTTGILNFNFFTNINVTNIAAYYIYVVSIDAAGNTNTSASNLIAVADIPIVSITSPAPSGSLIYTNTSNPVAVSGTASTLFSSVSNVWAIVNNATNNAAGTTSWSYNASLIVNATNTLTIVANNNAGAGSQPQTIRIIDENNLPLVTITTVLPPVTNVSNFTVNATAIDALSGIASTFYDLNNGIAQNFTGGVFTVSNLMNGTNKIYVWAKNLANNSSITQSVNTIVDTTPPVLTAVYMTNNQLAGSNYTLSGTAVDAYSTIAAVNVEVDNNGFNPTVISQGTNWSINLTVPYGLHTNYIKLTDILGNTSSNYQVVINNVASFDAIPVITNAGPALGIWSNENISLYFNVPMTWGTGTITVLEQPANGGSAIIPSVVITTNGNLLQIAASSGKFDTIDAVNNYFIVIVSNAMSYSGKTAQAISILAAAFDKSSKSGTYQGGNGRNAPNDLTVNSYLCFWTNNNGSTAPVFTSREISSVSTGSNYTVTCPENYQFLLEVQGDPIWASHWQVVYPSNLNIRLLFENSDPVMSGISPTSGIAFIQCNQVNIQTAVSGPGGAVYQYGNQNNSFSSSPANSYGVTAVLSSVNYGDSAVYSYGGAYITETGMVSYVPFGSSMPYNISIGNFNLGNNNYLSTGVISAHVWISNTNIQQTPSLRFLNVFQNGADISSQYPVAVLSNSYDQMNSLGDSTYELVNQSFANSTGTLPGGSYEIYAALQENNNWTNVISNINPGSITPIQVTNGWQELPNGGGGPTIGISPTNISGYYLLTGTAQLLTGSKQPMISDYSNWYLVMWTNSTINLSGGANPANIGSICLTSASNASNCTFECWANPAQGTNGLYIGLYFDGDGDGLQNPDAADDIALTNLPGPFIFSNNEDLGTLSLPWN